MTGDGSHAIEMTQASAEAAAERSAKNTPVLIVDDDESIRETLRYALEDEGYPVLMAQDGASALEMMQNSSRGLVVLVDHVMPYLDGETMLRTLAGNRALAERHAYVMITASAQASHLETTLATLPLLSPISVVRKPFDLETLFSCVRDASGRLFTH